MSQYFPLLTKLILLVHVSAFAAAPGITDKEIVIGVSTTMTGPSAARPSRQLEGSKILFDKINKAGGVNGRQLRLVSYDDGYDPRKSIENAQKLIDQDKVFLFYNFYGTPTIKALMPFLTKNDIPMVAPSSGASFFRFPADRNIYNVKPGHWDESETMVHFLTLQGIKNISIFYQDDSFGGDGRLGVSTSMNKLNLKAASVGSYARNTTDISEAYAAIKKSNPDAVVMWSLGDIGIQFIKMAIKDKWNPVFFLASNQLNEEMIEASKDWKAKVYVALNLPPAEDSKLEIARQYVADSKAAKVALEPNRFEGYVNAAVLIESLKIAGKDLTRDSLRLAFNEKMKDVNIGSLKCEYSKDIHQAFSKTFVAQVIKGKVVVEPEESKK